MLAECLVLASLQIGPFFEKRSDCLAVRPFYSEERGEVDVLWPLFTAHRDWWRFAWFVEGHRGGDGSRHFSVMPFWFSGTDPKAGDYWAFFPFWGRHPHFALMYDIDFVLWPVWMRYRMPRPSQGEWMTTNAVLFPFVSWRSDGSWGFWPFYGVNHQRESDHRYALWPLVTWAKYRDDRDTAGAGSSWMVWPFYGRVRRTRERQDSLLPPFFSVATAWGGGRSYDQTVNSGPASFRLRCPWPFFEYESVLGVKERLSVWPFYERQVNFAFGTGERSSSVTRFGWKLVELYDNETRVFPFYVHSWGVARTGGERDYLRVWPFWEAEREGEVTSARTLSLVPIRWVPAVARNWSKFWTLYERRSNPLYTDHSLLWGLINWRSPKD